MDPKYRSMFHFRNGDDLFLFHDKEIPYLSFRCLDQTGIVKSAFTLRQKKSGQSVCLFWHEEVDENRVRQDNAILAEELGGRLSGRVSAAQKHTANVHVVTEKDLGSCLPVSPIEETDALVTDLPGTWLCVSVADCIPLLFVDPVKKVIAAAHSGRKGTQKGIGRETVRVMKEAFGCSPEDIIATIGPGICAGCYEVGPEIYDEFAAEWPKEKRDAVFCRTGEKDHLDLWEANRIVLREAGLKEENITVTNLCNRCNSEWFYSYRADGKILNQIAACLFLREM